jgi:hypothetical protein
MKIIIKFIISIYLGVSILAYADTDSSDWYQINVIIFEHITPEALQSETWPAITNMPNLKDAIDPQLLPQEQSQLKIENRRFNRKIAQRENYKVLLNISWQQEIPITYHAEPIHISGDKIDGTITINKDRYFNIKTNLILTEPTDYLNSIGPGHYAQDNESQNFQMLQTRRMRSNELNYLDYPLFGMLIKIIPLSLPVT